MTLGKALAKLFVLMTPRLRSLIPDHDDVLVIHNDPLTAFDGVHR